MAGNDVVHLGVHALPDQLRRILAVKPVQLAVDKVLEVLDRVFDLRREQVVRHRPHGVAPVHDQVRVFDHDLVRLFLPQIAEFVQHLIRRAEVQRQRPVSVRHLLGRHEDMAVDLVLGV